MQIHAVRDPGVTLPPFSRETAPWWRDWVLLLVLGTGLAAIFAIPVMRAIWLISLAPAPVRVLTLHAGRQSRDRNDEETGYNRKRFKATRVCRFRGVAQSGSASALGAEGRGFESLRPDHRKP